jgi:hypothetical protein
MHPPAACAALLDGLQRRRCGRQESVSDEWAGRAGCRGGFGAYFRLQFSVEHSVGLGSAHGAESGAEAGRIPLHGQKL